MAEPQPADVHEGAATPNAPSDLTGAAALSSLNDAPDTSNGAKKEVDSKALDKAMQGLSVKNTKAEDDKKKNVKIDAADVTLLVRLSLCIRIHTHTLSLSLSLSIWEFGIEGYT